MRSLILNAIDDPYFWLTVGAYLYSSVIQSLPTPTVNAAEWYVFIYRFLHALGANWKQYKQASFIECVQSEEKLVKDGVSPKE